MTPVRTSAAAGGRRTRNVRAVAEAYVRELRTLYGRVQRSMFDLMASEDLTEFSAWRFEDLLRQVNAQVEFLDREAAAWSKRAMGGTYDLGVELARKRLDALAPTELRAFGSRIHSAAVEALAQHVATELVTANGSIRRTVSAFIRTTQQRIVADREISEAVAGGLIGGAPRRFTSGEIERLLRAKIGNRQFVQVAGRAFEPAYYAELVARTRTREAVSRGTINQTRAYGFDLVRVSVHEHPQNDPCLLHQGKVYSLDGRNRDFPRLDASPPFHPNCRHVLTPVVAEALERRGKYDDAVRFSNSDRFVTSLGGRQRSELPGPDVKGPSTRSAQQRARQRARDRARVREAVGA